MGMIIPTSPKCRFRAVPGLMRTLAPPSNPAPKPQPNPPPHRTVATLVSVAFVIASEAANNSAPYIGSGCNAAANTAATDMLSIRFDIDFSPFLDSASVYAKAYRAMKWQG